MTYLNNILKISLSRLGSIEQFTATLYLFGFTVMKVDVRLKDRRHTYR